MPGITLSDHDLFIFLVCSVVYGPLCNGATTVMFESVPTHPDPYRYWDLVQKHKVTQFYTAPTASTY